MSALMRKEIVQAWRSFRFPGLLLLTFFFALLDPISLKYMPDILQQFAGEITITMPPPVPADGITSFLQDYTQLGLFVAILITMSSLAGERQRGVLTWILTKPVSRAAYLLVKFLSGYVMIGASLLAGTGLCYFYVTGLMGPVDPFLAAVSSLAAGVYVALIITVVVAVSSLARQPLAAGIAGFGAMFFFWFPRLLLGGTPAGRYLPSRLISDLGGIMGEKIAPADLVPAVLTALLLSAAIVILAALRFNRAELEG